MTVKRILFIRPGETDWNRAGKQQGIVASPLNALGRRQAEKLANVIRVIGVSQVYSSPTRRAAQTVEILAAKLGEAPIYDERLRERAVGIWQGLTNAEIRAWYPEEYAALQSLGEQYQIPGGESRYEVRLRMQTALSDIMAQSKGETIAILSHTTAIKMALLTLMGGEAVQMSELTNTSVTTVVRDDESSPWRLVAVDDVLHLEGMETQAFIELEDKQ